MKDKASVVEINGLKYDAVTGKPLSEQRRKRVKTTGRLIDGFSAPHSLRSVNSAKKHHKTTKKSNKLHPLASTNKPAKAKPSEEKVIKKSSLKPNPKRHYRAKITPLSKSISKFSNRFSQPDQDQNDNLNKATEQNPVTNPIHNPVATNNNPAPQNEPTVDKVAEQNWFSKLRQEKPKLIPTIAGVLSVLLIAGYITHINLPNMALKLAASKAGFTASLPGYRPAGFSMNGPIAYAPGQIAVRYTSNSDDRGFTIIQRQSNWDSQSLYDNYLAREDKRPVIFQEKGLTIYVYDGSNATWVDGGVWYTIEGDSLLSSEQILKIASSL